MIEQHTVYVQALQSLGVAVLVLPALEGYPDAYFVEDAAVVTPDIAILTRPGAPSRRGEVDAIGAALAGYRKTVHIQPPGTVEGGDVLMVGNHFFIGISERTNRAGAEQLGRILAAYGNTWTPVPVEAGLHLKSSVSYIGDQTLLVTEQLAFREEFQGFRLITLEKNAAYAANALLINDRILVPAGFPGAKKALETTGRQVIEIDVSEARKMDGGLSCMSLRF